MRHDQRRIDKDLNIGAAYPDLMQRVEEWRIQSRKARLDIRCRTDIAYGSLDREQMDLFLAQGGGAWLVFIHGGSWRTLDKEVFGFVARGFVPAGINVCVLNFPLSPVAGVGEIVSAVRRGLIYLASGAAGIEFDAARTVICGHSAGGHLAAMMALTDWRAFEVAQTPFAAVCAIGGLYDLEPVRQSFLNEQLVLDKSTAAALSPVKLVRKIDQEVILSIGGKESPEFRRQHNVLYDAWSATGQAIEDIVLEGDDHFSVLDQLVEGHGVLNAALKRQVMG